MMTLRKIIHIDMDCFYASIEMRDNPAFKDKPLAVGGNSRQRGVLSTCNYIARQFGLHSAMPTAQAIKRCPDLVLVPVNMPLYKQVSQQINQIFHRYTDVVEPLSLDEAYLDVTESPHCSGSATWIAEEIRQTIFKETGLTASAGVAPLKFLAKIASDYNKPNGIFVVNPKDVDEFVRKLPLKKIPGVGKVTTERLLNMGLKTCEDVQYFDQSILLHQFGKMGMRLWHFAHGIDERSVQPNRERKSVAVEKTLIKNIAHLEQGLMILSKLYPVLIHRIKNACPNIPLNDFHKVEVKLKFDDFTITTLEKSAVEFSENIFRELLMLIWHRCRGRTVRLVGIQVTIPEKKIQKQMALW